MKYGTLKDALAAAKEIEGATVITLLADVETDEILKVEGTKKIEINGQGLYTVTSSAKKTFEVYSYAARFVDLKIANTYNGGRCVDSRIDNTSVSIINCTLTAQGAGSQPVTVGGTDERTDKLTPLSIQNSTIKAGDGGYAIIAFVPTKMAITTSNIEGYCAIYMKEGTQGSTIDISGKSVLTGNNPYSGYSNSFGAVVFEDDGIELTLDASAKIVANATGDQPECAFGFKNGVMNTLNIAGSVEAKEGQILSGFNYNEDALVTVTNADVLAALKADNYIVDENGVVLGKVLSVKINEDMTITTDGVKETCILVVSSYTEKGRMIDVGYMSLDGNITNKAISDLNLNTENANTIKAFIIKDFITMSPLCAAAVAIN